ncbi:hypothetical protein AB0F03_35570 [Streptomyces sp. NPDC028722]|uniref:hypothetical protein n=1 Tax=Streptomyces sp. NPDC028722 TaxID=3155016 RepID=UPI0033E0505B
MLVVRVEVRRESLARKLCLERPGQLSLREPSDEGVDGILSGGVLRKPQIQVLLVQVREGELVLVEPVQQEDGGSDVTTVGFRGAGSVAPALRSAACVLDDVPFREGADDPGLVWGQGFEGGFRPELEPGEDLVAFGEGSGQYEVVPDVACDRALRQPVEEPVTDLGVLRAEFVEESGRDAEAVTSDKWGRQPVDIIARIPGDQSMPLLESIFLKQLAAAETANDYGDCAYVAEARPAADQGGAVPAGAGRSVRDLARDDRSSLPAQSTPGAPPAASAACPYPRQPCVSMA